ncbi:MAG: glutathione peroxidase [Dehalococcoidia bacterium]|jgi:glutathione peroxidase|nr:glutathione peroxidase [Dehalococcoidia bacterium]|tara:strand:- start:44 stop:529 length:486 start_codon:yes stop_codon:yes gene_type:complete
MSSSVYDHSFKSIDGDDMIDLSDFKGKTMVVVNTASHCGFTHQYKGLQTLHNSHEDLVVIGVPSNDFGNQEPADNEEIRNFCNKKFKISFPLAEKSVVKGKDAHPFFKWARQELGFVSGVPRWNFHKIIIDKNGNAVTGYTSLTKPNSKRFRNKIENLLKL